MTRREALSLPILSVAPAWRDAEGRPAPDQNLSVPNPHYSRCLPDYLRGLAAEAYERRNREIATLTTAAAISARQHWARETFWNLIGGRPERTPLNSKTMASLERPGYRMEKVVYESRPGFFITANLYLPAGAKGRLPGVVFSMGHSPNGKADASYQRCAQGLAQSGYVVLAFDPMGQGERVYYLGSSKRHSRLANPDAEHTVPGRQMILYGDTVTRMQVWDAIRSLDFLAAHPQVDPKRIGATGHSGGGTVTMLLSAADERLAAAAVIMGNTENVACAKFHPPGSTDDAEQNLPGSAPLGFDRWDLLYPLAPKPLLVAVSDKDCYATYSPEYIADGTEQFDKLRKIYEVLGRPEAIAWGHTPLPHALGYDCRMQIYNWFGRWLKGDTQPVTEEPPVKPEPDEATHVTESGSTIVSLGSATPFSLLKQYQHAKTAAPLEKLLAFDRPAPDTRFEVKSRVKARTVQVEALEVRSAPGVLAPAWLLTPEKHDANTPVLLALDPQSREALWFASEVDHVLPVTAPLVCAADVRGVGDLTPEFSPGASEYARWHEAEENYAWCSLIFGKPLVGQRVTDILAVVAALASHPLTAGRPIKLAARGKLTVPALLAAALEPRIAELYLADGLVSFADIAAKEDYRHPFANFVPHLLNHTDLPDIAHSLAPRRILLAGAVDGRDRALSVEATRAVYSGDHVTIAPRADWTVRGLTAWVLGG